MKIVCLLMLLAFAMAETTEYETKYELQAGNNIICYSAVMLMFYAPLHTVAWCALNYSQGWSACLDEFLVMLASTAGIYTTGCLILP